MVAGPGEQAFDRIISASLDRSHWSGARTDSLSGKHYRRAPGRMRAKPPRIPQAGADSAHFHRVVRRWLADPANAPRRAELILVFRDSVEAPRFPAALVDTLIGSPEWTLQRHVADSLVAATEGRRAVRYATDSLALALRRVTTLDHAWLIQSMLVDAPITRAVLRAIVDTIGAVYVQPRYARESPPGDNGYGGDDPVVARGTITSDPYVPFAPQYGQVALLDTGVRKSHELLPARIATTYDCLGPDCLAADIGDPCGGHGTAAAALLSGVTPATSSGYAEDRFGGVTDAELCVYGIYTSDADCSTGAQLDTWAACRAIAHAVSQSLPIIVAEVDGEVVPEWGYEEEDWNAMAAEADEAFEKGSLVVAAAGNQGVGHIASPAVARRVISAGGYHVVTSSRYSNGGTGPTKDNRYKPEVSAPTSTETADNDSDSDYATFDATSGATPYVAGAAVLLRNWLVQAAGGSESNIDPGQVCAQLIVSGQSPSTPVTGTDADAFERLEGAGRIVLPTNGWCWFGKVSIDKTDALAEVFIGLGADTFRKLEVALWWPETPLSQYSVAPGTNTHNDIDLELLDPTGVVAADSRVGEGVFERATVSVPTGRLTGGVWKLNVLGNDVAAGPQTVYWTVVGRY